MRDIHKQAEQGRAILEKHPKANLTTAEVLEFYKIFRDDESADGGLVGVIAAAFEMGVAVGARNSK